MKNLYLALILCSAISFGDTPPLKQTFSDTFDGVGNPITSTASAGKRYLDVNLLSPSIPIPTSLLFGGSVIDPRTRGWTLNAGVDSVAAVISSVGPLTLAAPATAMLIGAKDSLGNLQALQVDATGNLKINGTFTPAGTLNVNVVNIPTVTANAGAGTFQTNLSQLGGTLFSATNSLPSRITNGVSFVDPTQIRALNSGTDSVTITGSITANRPTAPTATITPVATVAGSSVTVLPANSFRKGLILFNRSAGFQCYVAFSSTSSPTAFTFQLVQGGSYHMNDTIYQGAISAFCSTGTILVTEM